MPTLPRIIRRPRLFDELDKALKRRVIWIAGPPGAGKTTLVVSYLRTRRCPVIWDRLDERDSDLSSFVHYLAKAIKAVSGRQPRARALTSEFRFAETVFVRQFFEDVSACLPRRSVIVFDNYQDVPTNAPLHAALPFALNEIAGHLSVVIVSRALPSEGFAALGARGDLAVIPAERLALTAPEQRALITLYYPTVSLAIQRKWMRRVQFARGWLAGATLLLQRGMADIPLGPAHEGSHDVIFGYLISEIFNRATPGQRQFLLVTSLIPQFTSAIAQRVTGALFAAEYLAHLYRARLFADRIRREADWYSYHPLFRRCLTSIAHRIMAAHEIAEIRCESGRALLEAGHVDDAIGQFVAAGAWESAMTAILAAAPQMVAQGRVRTLERWVCTLPWEFVKSRPWLCYWLATCRVAIGVPDASRLAHEAMASFQTSGDTVGKLAAWSLTVLAISEQWGDLSSLDDLIPLFNVEDPKDLRNFPSELVPQLVNAYATALTLRQPGKPRTDRWVAHALELRQSASVAGQAVPFPWIEGYYIWLGNISAARNAFGAFLAKPLPPRSSMPSRLAYHFAEALMWWAEGERARCRTVIARAVTYIAQRGWPSVYAQPLLTQGIYNELMSGDVEAAAPLLAQMRVHNTRQDNVLACHRAALEAWHRLHLNDLDAAWALVAPQAHRPEIYGGPYATGFAWIVRAFIRFAAGEPIEATACTKEASHVAESMNSEFLRHGIGFLNALGALARNDEAEALTALRDGLGIGRRNGIWGCPGWHVPAVASLLAKALNAGIETEYIRELIRRRHLPRPTTVITRDAWDWPVAIRALGGFEIIVNGKLLTHRRKAPHRLLEVLRAIVAAGATKVSISQVCDRFWPDVDGDASRENLDKTLQRLRHLLGRPDVFLVRSGRVALNSDICWTDVAAFEQLVALGRASEARSLYQGPLFGSLPLKPWELAAQNRLASRRGALDR